MIEFFNYFNFSFSVVLYCSEGVVFNGSSQNLRDKGGSSSLLVLVVPSFYEILLSNLNDF